MGNEQSVGGHPAPDTGLRLSTLCLYHAETGSTEEGLGFSWFQPSTDVSGLALRGAHRWGYVLSHMGGQRLFKDSRQRFFVLLDHYMCYFDSHAPEARMKGSIDLDKTRCHLELLPRPPESTDMMLQGTTTGGEGDEHRVEISSRAGGDNDTDDGGGGSSMILCFSSANSLSDWMKSIFDVQQRKATFSPLRHSTDGGGTKEDIEADDDDDDNSGLPRSLPRRGRYYTTGNVGASSTAGNVLRTRRGTLDSPPPRSPRPQPPHGGRGGGRGAGSGVPSSWADGIATEEEGRGRQIRRDRSMSRSPSPSPSPQREENSLASLPPSSSSRRPHATSTSSAASVLLGKASERLAGLPRGGRAAGNRDCSHGGGGNGNADEYGAFTTAQASIYEGWTRGLQPHGWGRMVFANGDCVEGWWEHDVLQGSGEYTSQREGWTYRGGYVAGERHGPGRLVTAQSDIWECEWTHGVVASASRGTHATAAGELYQGGCGPSAEDPAVPCRTGQGRLRRRNGEQVDARFRAGKAVDGAKGVVRFRNGAIFFGELHDARPHGYGELYLSSVKIPGNRSGGGSGSADSRKRSCRRKRKSSGSLAELDEMAKDVLWYKGQFHLGKPHGSGLVKYKEPLPAAAAAAAASSSARGDVAVGTQGRERNVSPSRLPLRGGWGESKDEDVEREEAREGQIDGRGVGAEVGVDTEGEEENEERGAPLVVGATDEVLPEEEEDEDDDDDDDDEDDDSTSDSDDDEDDGEDQGGARTDPRGTTLREAEGGEEKATPGVMVRTGQRRPPVESEGGGGGDGDGGGADMEYEAEFVCGVMVRHDPSHLRLAALRFGRAEIRRLETLLRKEEDAMSRMRAKGLCLLCNAEEMNALLVGCRHRVLCVGCAERAECCPVCGERIGEVVKTYST